MTRPKGIQLTFTPCSLRQPPATGEYIVYLGNYITSIVYNKKHNMWNVSGDDTSTDMTVHIIAWAPLTPCTRALEHFKEGRG